MKSKCKNGVGFLVLCLTYTSKVIKSKFLKEWCEEFKVYVTQDWRIIFELGADDWNYSAAHLETNKDPFTMLKIDAFLDILIGIQFLTA